MTDTQKFPVSLQCPKCLDTSHLSEKEWMKHWHGVEYNCPKCNTTLLHNDKVLQSFGHANGTLTDWNEIKDNTKTWFTIVFWMIGVPIIIWFILNS